MAKPYWNLFRTQEQRPWPKVGVAFMNKDGSYNLRLRNNITAADKLQMREGKHRDQAREQTKEQGAQASVADKPQPARAARQRDKAKDPAKEQGFEAGIA